MELSVGQKVSYPNQGVCMVEEIEKKSIAGSQMKFYSLRVLSDNSTIFVPTANAEAVGLRPIIGSKQCKSLLYYLGEDFDKVSSDWKVRSREFNDKLQSGDIFEAADVLKKLTYLSTEKKLSFREQSLLEKSKFLIVSELRSAEDGSEKKIEKRVEKLIQAACGHHSAVLEKEEEEEEAKGNGKSKKKGH
ncbi:MAG TPA: CarD family transcriptional regulator [Aridibacter sp.]|nr:CarD family transcriptional regulator [Aridibacter sp.]